MSDDKENSSWKQFIASIAAIKGDLSNITAPPFVLADKSTTEFPRYWIEHPELFCAPASEPDPARRLLAVVKWFLASLRGQLYAGRNPEDGIKKPLNAFLGEVFVGECGQQDDLTKLVSEQVCHHPPVTACCLWNEKHGVKAEGFTRQEITMNINVSIKQIGYAVLHVDEFDEDYLIPLPDIKVSGILTGKPYPELEGTYSIPSSSGFVADIDFSGKKALGLMGQKHHVEASIHHLDTKEDVLFKAEGSWWDKFVLRSSDGKEIETYDASTSTGQEFRTLPLERQDPWESRRAWSGVIDGMRSSDMQAIAKSKSELENAQRELRKQPEYSESNWKPLFFRKDESDARAQKLHTTIGRTHDSTETCGIWRFEKSKSETLKRPWRGDLTPHNAPV